MEDKKVKFSAEENVSPFIKKLQAEAQRLYGTLAEEAKKQAGSAKDQNKFISDRLRLLREELDYLKKINAEKLKASRESLKFAQADYDMAEGPDRAKFAGVVGGIRATIAELEAKQADLDAQKRTTREAGNYRQPQEDKKSSVFSDIMRAGLVRDVIGAMRQTVGAQTGLDLLTPALGMMGAGTGAGVGALLEAATLGQIEFAVIGSQMGQAFGEMAGQGITRHIQTKEKFLAAAMGIQALTGQAMQGGDLAEYGLDQIATADLEQRIVRGIGRAATSSQVRDVAALSKWGNVDSNVIIDLMKTGRMASFQSGKPEQAMAEMFTMGIDRSVLGEAVSKMTALITNQAQYRLTASGDEAMVRMAIGERLGGPFAARDPRSTQLEIAYQDKLSNPGSAFAQALSYSVLRARNPKASMVELIKKRQAGGVQYERDLLEQIGGMTGSEDLNTLLYSQLFGTGTMAFDEARLAGRKMFHGGIVHTDRSPSGQAVLGGKGSIDAADPMAAIRAEAAALTTQMQKDTAEVNNAFIKGFTNGIEVITTQFKERFLQAFEDFIDSKLDGLGVPKDPNPKLPDKAPIIVGRGFRLN